MFETVLNILFLLILIFNGLILRKKTDPSLTSLLVSAAGVLIWSVISFFADYGEEYRAVILWTVSLTLGLFYGFSYLQKNRFQIIGNKAALHFALFVSANKLVSIALKTLQIGPLDRVAFFLDLLLVSFIGALWGAVMQMFVAEKSKIQESE